MSTLRDDIEQVIVDHFDPSIMGRAQAVDDILSAIKQHDEALANRSMPPSKPLTPGPGGANIVMAVDPTTPVPRSPGDEASYGVHRLRRSRVF